MVHTGYSEQRASCPGYRQSAATGNCFAPALKDDRACLKAKCKSSLAEEFAQLVLAHLGSRFVFCNVLAKLVGAGCV